MSKKLEVGQYLWCVPGNRSEEPKQVQITEIGAKTATLDTGAKISKRTLLPTGGAKDFKARFYLSEAEWLRKVEIERQWTILRRMVEGRYNAPSNKEAAAVAVKLLSLVVDAGAEQAAKITPDMVQAGVSTLSRLCPMDLAFPIGLEHQAVEAVLKAAMEVSAGS